MGTLKRWLIAVAVMIPVIAAIDFIDTTFSLTRGIDPATERWVRLALSAAIAGPLWAWIIAGGSSGGAAQHDRISRGRRPDRTA